MIIALHGFLGLSSDWTHFDGHLLDPNTGRPLTIRKWNLYQDLPEQPPTGPESPLRTWAKGFCDRIRTGWQKHGEEGRTKPILMGYSLGGRLALHALLEDESLFSAAVVIGAHPGLIADDLRLQRRLNDVRWAERFRGDEWRALLAAWGAQEVFRNPERDGAAIELPRQAGDFDRVKLARMMLAWSLAEQENLRPELASLKLPVLWVTGQSDRRFDALMSDLHMDLVDSPSHRWVTIPKAGHRAPWDNPPEFVVAVQEFINQVL